ncbi:hypothetical protein Tco_0090120 [Tanacetum coccineum]
MKRGFRGVPRPLLPAMLPVVAVDQSAGQADQAVDQPSPSEPLPSSSHPPVISATTESEPTPVAEPTPHPKSPEPEPASEPIEHKFELHTLNTNHFHAKPYTKELKQTKSTIGKELVKLVKKVKKMEDVLKRRHVGSYLIRDRMRNFFQTGEEFKQKEGYGLNGYEDISPNNLEGSPKTSESKLLLKRSKSVDKGKRYKRRKESKGEDISNGFEDISTGFEEVNTETQAPKRTKEQIQQEEASLAEAIRLQTLEEEETTKQVHLDALLAKRMEEEELTELNKSKEKKLRTELPEEEFAKNMVELVNQRKKFFAEERAKARRMLEEVKEEFDKLVKQVESFVPINIEATKAQLKRYGEELQTEISKKQRIDDKDVSDTEEKVGKVKEEEPVKRVGKRKKQKAMKRGKMLQISRSEVSFNKEFANRNQELAVQE